MKIHASELKVYDDIITINYRDKKNSNLAGIEVESNALSINPKIVFDLSDNKWKLDNGDGNLKLICTEDCINNLPVKLISIENTIVTDTLTEIFNPIIYKYLSVRCEFTNLGDLTATINLYSYKRNIFVQTIRVFPGRTKIIKEANDPNIGIFVKGNLSYKINGLGF